MDGFERLRKSALSLGTYLYEHSGKLMEIHLMAKIPLTLKYCNVGKYTRVFKTLLLESISCLFRK